MMPETMHLKICHLYPDLLNLYGDRGNIMALRRRCEWRGISCEVIEVGAGQDADFEDIDLFFIGGGQDFDQNALLDDLGVRRSGSKAARLRDAIEADVPVLAICGGYQLLGEYYKGADGTQMHFVGALALYTEAGQQRLIGNIVYRADAVYGEPVVVAFENHAGRTRLRDGLKPLGTVVEGFGNNGEDGTEGARYRNVFGTYGHGPLLPKNPAVADELLRLALQRKYPGAALAPLDDTLELSAHDSMVARFTRGF